MPYINVRTNAAISGDKEESIVKKLGQAITLIPGKTEKSLMINLEENCAIYYAGAKVPAAYVQIKILGQTEESAYKDIYDATCNILADELDIPKEAIYINFQENGYWGVRDAIRK